MHSKLLSLTSALFFGIASFGDQPIFNEMPRWDNGWGFQIVEEHRSESDLLLGETVIAKGFSEEIYITHLEGVYTWDKSIRVTAKLPYVRDAMRELPDGSGGKLLQEDEGWGDLTLALPLKRYFNLDGRSGSWTFAPQLRIPLSEQDEYEVYDQIWRPGISVGYETETHKWIMAIGAATSTASEGMPSKSSMNIDLGFNFRAFNSSGHAKWETDYLREGDGSETLVVGPSLYWRFTDTVHGKIMWKRDTHDRQGTLDHGNGRYVKIGLGFVY